MALIILYAILEILWIVMAIRSDDKVSGIIYMVAANLWGAKRYTRNY